MATNTRTRPTTVHEALELLGATYGACHVLTKIGQKCTKQLTNTYYDSNSSAFYSYVESIISPISLGQSHSTLQLLAPLLLCSIHRKTPSFHQIVISSWADILGLKSTQESDDEELEEDVESIPTDSDCASDPAEDDDEEYLSSEPLADRRCATSGSEDETNPSDEDYGEDRSSNDEVEDSEEETRSTDDEGEPPIEEEFRSLSIQEERLSSTNQPSRAKSPGSNRTTPLFGRLHGINGIHINGDNNILNFNVSPNSKIFYPDSATPARRLRSAYSSPSSETIFTPAESSDYTPFTSPSQAPQRNKRLENHCPPSPSPHHSRRPRASQHRPPLPLSPSSGLSQHTFSSAAKLRTPIRFNTDIKDLIRKGFTEEELRKYPDPRGRVYIFVLPEHEGTDSPPLKIGHSTGMKERMAGIKKFCKYKPFVLVDEPCPMPRRIEKLLHEILDGEALRQHCAGCKKQHREWYQVDFEFAKELLLHWVEWSRKEPYDSNNNLKDKWFRQFRNRAMDEPDLWKSFRWNSA